MRVIMKTSIYLAIGFIFSFIQLSTVVAQEADLVQISIAPNNFLILNPTNEGKGYYDTIIHTIAISPSSASSITIDNVKITFLYKGQDILSKNIQADRIVGESQGINEMAQMGLNALLNEQLLNADGVSGLFNRPATIASQAKIDQGEVLLTMRHHFSLDFLADEAVITAEYKTSHGQINQTSKTIPVQLYSSHMSYASPLDGIWLATANSSLQTHHRLHPSTEYAIDFFKLNVDGEIHNGDDCCAENYFGFGAPVMAAADGEVILVISDVIQDRKSLRQNPDESEQEAGRRLMMLNFQKMADDFPRATAGNLVVIKHEINGQTEYSSYGHLAPNSITVAIGDIIKRGDTLGKVGDTGDSDTVHLHFQINAGPSPFISKSLPIHFENLADVNQGADPLKFVLGRSSGKAHK